jgi:hypothetical protein
MTHPEEPYTNPVLTQGRDAISEGVGGKNRKGGSATTNLQVRAAQTSIAIKGLAAQLEQSSKSFRVLSKAVVEQEERDDESDDSFNSPVPTSIVSSSSSSNTNVGLLSSAIGAAASNISSSSSSMSPIVHKLATTGTASSSSSSAQLSYTDQRDMVEQMANRMSQCTDEERQALFNFMQSNAKGVNL